MYLNLRNGRRSRSPYKRGTVERTRRLAGQETIPLRHAAMMPAIASAAFRQIVSRKGGCQRQKQNCRCGNHQQAGDSSAHSFNTIRAGSSKNAKLQN